jgi:hypothetical protein
VTKEEVGLGDIRINKKRGKPEVCKSITFGQDGTIIRAIWQDYKTELLWTTPGMCPNCQILHTLDYFRHGLELYKIDYLSEEEIDKKRDVLEDKIETLLDAFNTDAGIRVKEVVVWIDNHTKKPVVAVEVEET